MLADTWTNRFKLSNISAARSTSKSGVPSYGTSFLAPQREFGFKLTPELPEEVRLQDIPGVHIAKQDEEEKPAKLEEVDEETAFQQRLAAYQEKFPALGEKVEYKPRFVADREEFPSLRATVTSKQHQQAQRKTWK